MAYFDPAEYFYDPEVMAAQRELERASVPEEPTFANFFTGGFDLSTDDGRQAWATSGISGLFLAELSPEEDQRRWFIQRNSVDLGYKELNNIINAYQSIADTRQLSKEEEEELQEALARKETIERDLGYVFDNQDGNLDAPIDTQGQSFNQRWGLETKDETAYSDFINLVMDHPGAMAGGLTAEIVKDAPLFGLAKILGVANKNLSVAEIVAKVNAKINKIEPKLLRGLTKVSAGVGVGAVAGGTYEGAYSALEQGEVKEEKVSMGAKFGATFGVLGGLALLAKGPKAPKVAEVAEEAAPVAKPNLKENATKENITKAFEGEDKDISLAAQETEILPNIEHKVTQSTATKKAIESTANTELNRVESKVNEGLLKQEHKGVVKELNESIRTGKDFRGVKADRLTPRVISNIRNYEAFRMMRLAEEKAKADMIMTARRNNQPAPTGADLDAQARIAAFNEFNRLDVERRGLPPERPLDDQYLEADRILKLRKGKSQGVIEESIPVKTPVQDFIAKNKKVGLGAGAAAGYLLAGEEEKIPGVALGLGAVALGPAAYKAITSTNLKAAALKAKLALAKDVEKFSNLSKELEAKMQFVLDKIDEVFPSAQEARMLIQAIETDTINKLPSKAQRDLAREIKTVLDVIGEEAVKSGVLKSKKDVKEMVMHKMATKDDQVHLLHNYFPHIFSKDIPDEIIQKLTEFYLKNSNNVKMRTIRGTIDAIKNNPEFADIAPYLIDDPRRALTSYVQSMTRTIYARNLLNSMAELDLSSTGERYTPALLSKKAFEILKSKESENGGLSTQQALNYVEFDHPTLKGYVAHNDIRGIINDHFAIIRKGGVQDLAEGILKLNNGLKRIFVFSSLFHGQALMLSALYTLGPFGFFGSLGKRLPVKNSKGEVIGYKDMTLTDLQVGSGEFKQFAIEAIRDGLQIINVKRTDLVNPGFADVEKLFEKGGFVGRGINQVFKKLDYITWEYMHDRFKLAAYIRKKELLIKNDGLEPEVAGRIAADFANDAFGSLDWNNLATRLLTYANNNPGKIRARLAEMGADILPVNKRRWLNLGLFAPDWTVSNLRIVGRVFTLGGKILSDKFLNKVHKGDDAAWKSKEGKELLAAWKLYAMYTARAGAITSGMWWGITELVSDKEASADGLWDFWFGPDSGKLDLGNGESMVISKQIAEPYHWVQHPRHTLLNKMSVVPKTLIEGMFNKQWISLKKGFPMGPAITDENGSHTAQWLLGKAIPISVKPLVDPNLPFSEKILRFVGGFFGFPQYNPPPKELDLSYNPDGLYEKDIYDSNTGYFE